MEGLRHEHESVSRVRRSPTDLQDEYESANKKPLEDLDAGLEGHQGAFPGETSDPSSRSAAITASRSVARGEATAPSGAGIATTATSSSQSGTAAWRDRRFADRRKIPVTNSADSQGATPGIPPNAWLSMDTPLEPFMRTESGEKYVGRDAFNIETQLGYTYGPGSLGVRQQGLPRLVPDRGIFPRSTVSASSSGRRRC
jgi:hypothetical protein